jgi:hypothetical protein
MWPQHAPNLMTLSQNVPSVEEGTRLKIVVQNVHSILAWGTWKIDVGKHLQRDQLLPPTFWRFWSMMKRQLC